MLALATPEFQPPRGVFTRGSTDRCPYLLVAQVALRAEPPALEVLRPPMVVPLMLGLQVQ